MFDINNYKFDEEHNYLEIAGEAMIFHCHHYLTNLQRTILDADYIDSRPFMVGSAADAVYNQLSNLCIGSDIADAKKMAEDIYKCFGYGLIKLNKMDENGIELTTTKSFFSKAWDMKFGKSDKPVDYYTTGFLAAAYAVVYNKPLSEVHAEQIDCIACGACAVVCPVGTIQIRIHEDTGEAEISPFKSRAKLLLCEGCGKQLVTEPVAKQILDKIKIDWDEFRERVRLCPECRRKKTAEALGLIASKSQ